MTDEETAALKNALETADHWQEQLEEAFAIIRTMADEILTLRHQRQPCPGDHRG